MNRPNKNNYYDYVLTCLPPIRVTKEKQYIEDLEIYCDKLEKALDKVLDLYENNSPESRCDYCPLLNIKFPCEDCKKEIKEWCMKDE